MIESKFECNRREPDEDGQPACRIAIFRDKTAQVRELLRHEGIDPDSGNLVGTLQTGCTFIQFVGDNRWLGESLPPPIPADNLYDM